MLAQPALELREPQCSGFVQANQKREGLDIVERQPISVHSQKCCCYGHGDALVAVHERMILGQALPKCRRFLDDVVVIAGPRPRQSRFERASIPNAERASELGDQSGVDVITSSTSG